MSTAAQTGGERRMSRQGTARVRRAGGLGAVRGSSPAHGASPAGHRQRSKGRSPSPALQASSSAPRPRQPSVAGGELDFASKSCAAQTPQQADDACWKLNERQETISASAPALPPPPLSQSQPPPPPPPQSLPPPPETPPICPAEKPSASDPSRSPSASLLAPPAEPSALFSPKTAYPEFSSEPAAQAAPVHPEGGPLAAAPAEDPDTIVAPYGGDVVPSSIPTPPSRPDTPLSVYVQRMVPGSGEIHASRSHATIPDGIHRTHRYRSGHVRRRRGDAYAWSSTHDNSCITCPGGLLESGPPCVVFVWPRPTSTGMRARRALADAARWALATLRVLALMHLWPAEEGLALLEVSPCAPQAPLPRRVASRALPRPAYHVIEPNWDAAHDAEAAHDADAVATDGSGAAGTAKLGLRDAAKQLALAQ